MKRLIIADVKSNNNNGKSTGHYFAVAQNYLDLYHDCCNVIIAGGPIFKTAFKEKDILLLPYDHLQGLNWLRNKWHVLMNCRFLFKNTSPTDIIVMQHSGATTTLLGIAIFASKKNLFLIQYDTEAISSYFKRLIFNLAKHKIKGLLCPNIHIAESYVISNCIVPDYIYPQEKCYSTSCFEEKKYDIAIVGSICPDKGVIEATKALTKTKYKVLVAGKADETVANRIKNICKDNSNIELHIKYLTNEDYQKYIRCARFCLLNYSGVYADRSSGVVLDILFNRTPILGHKCNALNFIDEENVGFLFDDINNVCFDDIITKENYERCQKGITKYLDSQKKHKQKVIEFLNLNK